MTYRVYVGKIDRASGKANNIKEVFQSVAEEFKVPEECITEDQVFVGGLHCVYDTKTRKPLIKQEDFDMLPVRIIEFSDSQRKKARNLTNRMKDELRKIDGVEDVFVTYGSVPTSE